MKNLFANLAPGLLLAALGLVAGCTFTIGTDPNAAQFPSAQVPALTAGVQVEVVNGFTASSLSPMGKNQQADLQEFTQTAADILVREFAKKGVVVASGAQKRIVLRVLAPSLTQGFGFVRGVVSLEAQFGSATISTTGEAAGMDASRDFSTAISNSVAALIGHPDLRAYLAKP